MFRSPSLVNYAFTGGVTTFDGVHIDRLFFKFFIFLRMNKHGRFWYVSAQTEMAECLTLTWFYGNAFDAGVSFH